MAKVILICGRLCCGKTTYANALREKHPAAALSLDELMLSVYGEYLGENHEACAEKCRRYLLQKSLEVLNAGVDVILDWGFWTKESRQAIRAFYRERGVETEFHYLCVPQAEWLRRCALRNRQIDEGKTLAYHVDEGLSAKADRLFEEPDPSEMDVWVNFFS